MKAAILAVGLLLTTATASVAGRLEDIRARDYLTCGIFPRVAGFTTQTPDGATVGFEPDLCRAVAAAILGDADKTRFVLADSVVGMKNNAELDIVSRRLTWTLTREAGNGLLFGPTMFHDGATFLVAADDAARRHDQLSGATVCLHQGSEPAVAIAAYFMAHGLPMAPAPSSTFEGAAKDFLAGRCRALGADLSELAGVRARGAYRLIEGTVSKEPLALLMRQGDDAFYLIVRWTMFLLIAAEEDGVMAADVRGGKAAAWLAAAAETGKALGLGDDWIARVIGQVGNYGEIYDRHLGNGSPLKLPRGINDLWSRGGLLVAPPVR